MSAQVKCRTQGYSGNETVVTITISKTTCGDIKDGVALQIGQDGGFVIPFADFERAYKMLVEARKP